MYERVVSLFAILSTFLMLDPAVCADPQTSVPCWRVMRMVRTCVCMYMHTSVQIFLRHKFILKFEVLITLVLL